MRREAIFRRSVPRHVGQLVTIIRGEFRDFFPEK